MVSALLLVACGARTELDPFSSDAGSRPDVPAIDVPPIGPGMTVGLFSGNTATDGTTWERPFECGGFGNGGHRYSVVTFENPTGEALQVEVLVDWSFDGYLHVYESPFDPGQTDLRCLGADDDFNGTSQSRVPNINVPAGGSIDLVLSSFSAGSTGTYDVFVITQ